MNCSKSDVVRLMRSERLVTHDSLCKLEIFIELLAHWRSVTNLISEAGFQSVWERHVLDSVYLHHLFPTYRRWLDLGSGAGFPGIVLGILLAADARTQIHCVESDGRKCTFLRSVVQELNLPIKVHNKRADKIGYVNIGRSEAVTARAFSSIESVLHLSEDHMLAGAVLVLPRGKTSAQAVEALDRNRYTSVIAANPLVGGGMFVTISLKVRRV